GEGDGGEQVVVGVVVGLHEEDVGPGGDGVSPLDVQGDLAGPAAVGRRHGAAAILVDLGEGRVGQAETHVKLVQVVGDVRVDDGNRRAAAVAGDAVEVDLIEAVRVADLGGRGPGRAGAAVR